MENERNHSGRNPQPVGNRHDRHLPPILLLCVQKGLRPKRWESFSGSGQGIINHAFPEPDPGGPGLRYIRRWRPCPNDVGGALAR